MDYPRRHRWVREHAAQHLALVRESLATGQWSQADSNLAIIEDMAHRRLVADSVGGKVVKQHLMGLCARLRRKLNRVPDAERRAEKKRITIAEFTLRI